MSRARFPLCLLLALSVVVPFSACGRYADVAPPAASPRPAPAAAAETQPAQPEAPRSASTAELERYAEREKQSSGLERFEGGRMSDATLIVVLLLFVIIIILIT